MPAAKNPNLSREKAEKLLAKNPIRRRPDPDRTRLYKPRVLSKTEFEVPNGTKRKLGITELWCLLFEMNEALPRKRKMTDATIKDTILANFPPTRDSMKALQEGRETVNHIRTLYNRGRFTRNVEPKIQSVRYNQDGDVVDGRTGTRIVSR